MGNAASDLDEKTAATGTGGDTLTKDEVTEKTWDSRVQSLTPSKRSETPETATSHSEQDGNTYPEANIQLSRSSYTGIPKVTDSDERTAGTDMAHGGDGSFERPIVLYEDEDEGDVLFDDENVYEDPDTILTPKNKTETEYIDQEDKGYDGEDDNDDRARREEYDDDDEDEFTLLTEVEVTPEEDGVEITAEGDVEKETEEGNGSFQAEELEEEIVLEEYTYDDEEETAEPEEEEEIILEEYTNSDGADDEQELIELEDDSEEYEAELEALQPNRGTEDAPQKQEAKEILSQEATEEIVQEEDIHVLINYDAARDDESQVEEGAIEIYGTDDLPEGDDDDPPPCVTAVRSSDLRYAWAVNRLEQTFSHGATSPVDLGSPRRCFSEGESERKAAAKQEGPVDPDGAASPKVGDEEPRPKVEEEPTSEVQGSFSREMDGEPATRDVGEQEDDGEDSEVEDEDPEKEEEDPEEKEDARIVWAKNALSNLSNPALSEESEDIDMAFVEEYEAAFEAFLEQNPHFMTRNPNLVENLRIAKLQKLLERTFQAEFEMMDYLEYTASQKEEMVASYQSQLIEASRKRAAREIALQQDLSTMQQETRTMEGKMTWQMITKCATRAKKHQALVHKFKERPKTLLDVLPDLPETQAIRDAVTAPPGTNLSEEQEKDLRQFQVDNAFLNSEVSVLEKKLTYHQMTAKKHGWVDLVFLKMDPKRMKKLKCRYQKKLGVTF